MSRPGLGLFPRILLWFVATVLIVMAVTSAMFWFAQEEVHQQHLQKGFYFLRHQLTAFLPQLEAGTPISLHTPFGPPPPPFFIFDSTGRPLFQGGLAEPQKPAPIDRPPSKPEWADHRPPRPTHGHDTPWTTPEEIASIAIRVLAGAYPSKIIENRSEELLAETITASSGKRFVGLLLARQPPIRFMPRFLTDPAIGLRLLVLAGVAVMLCWVLARSIATPILELQRLSQRLAAGDFRERPPQHLTSRGDELGMLAHDFDRMSTTIEEVIKGQRQLLRDVSHELRSPLARIQIALALIQKDVPPEKTEIAAQIGQNLGRLNELIQQILDLSKLEQFRAVPLTADPVDLAAFIGELAVDVQFEADLQRKTIRTAFPPGPMRVSAIREFFRRAIENVLRNAVRHTAEGSEVLVTVLPDPATPAPRAIISIRDHGPGVPPELLSRLFEPFFRCEEDRGRQTGGAGLGLAIVKRAIEAHEGTVSARNHPEGGLEVEIVIPVAPAQSQGI